MFDEKSFLFLVFTAFIVAVIIIAFVPLPQIEEPGEPGIPECNEGQTKECMRGPCEGIQTCIDGVWNKCTVEVICTPGTSTPCVSNHCSSAYKICNDCGTGYGECMGLNES